MANRHFDEITATLAAEMPAARFRHVLGVLHTSTFLASSFDADLEKVQLAALLHDCAKGMGREELLSYIRENNVPVEAEDLEFPAILHGPVGASVARERFDIRDEEVLDAIFHHPVGRRAPSATLQVIMAADFTEPTRDFAEVDEVRKAVRSDPRSGLLLVLRKKVKHLEEAGRRPHSRVSEMIASLENC